MAHVLCQAPYNYNTRSAGLNRDYALNTVDEALLVWPQEIVCAERQHMNDVMEMISSSEMMHQREVTVLSLEIPDIYEYRNPELVHLIKEQYHDDDVWRTAQTWSANKWQRLGRTTGERNHDDGVERSSVS